MKKTPASFQSALSGKDFPIEEQIRMGSIIPNVYKLLIKAHPDLKKTDSLARSEADVFRKQYTENYLLKEIGKLTDSEKSVLKQVHKNATITDKVEEEEKPDNSLGARLADKLAAAGGSWKFIICFSLIMMLWITTNALFLKEKGFDPYPFILLNLVLSCLAALQAPVIMMSQNRQESKDRIRAKQDYMINLKAELEIRMAHEKLDHMLVQQHQELLAIQEAQTELLRMMKKSEMGNGIPRKNPDN